MEPFGSLAAAAVDATLDNVCAQNSAFGATFGNNVRAMLGAGCQILAHATVCTQARLGRSVIVNSAASVDHECRIAAGAHIGPGARVAGAVHVGERAFIGTEAVICRGWRSATMR
jgi:UDP-3-O-[3-hydroxymyristoyl] glucosamine N-acyltransferase